MFEIALAAKGYSKRNKHSIVRDAEAGIDQLTVAIGEICVADNRTRKDPFERLQERRRQAKSGLCRARCTRSIDWRLSVWV